MSILRDGFLERERLSRPPRVGTECVPREIRLSPVRSEMLETGYNDPSFLRRSRRAQEDGLRREGLRGSLLDGGRITPPHGSSARIARASQRETKGATALNERWNYPFLTVFFYRLLFIRLA